MYTEKELAKLIEDVEREFTAHLAKAEEDFKLAKSDESTTAAADAAPLAKAEDEKKPEEKKEEPKAEEKKEEKPAEEAPKAEEGEKAPEAKEESKEAPPAEDKKEAPADEAKAPEAPAAEGDDHGYDDEDMEHMHQMYSSMSHGELKAHHDAVRKALDAKGAAQQAEAPAPAMTKSETEVSVEVKSEETDLLKSEIAAKDAKIEELKKTLDGVTEILTKMSKRSAPVGKAITSLDVVAKSENVQAEAKTFTKSEITQILTKKAADPTLTKSDRDAINAYYGTGQVSIEKISHLLK
jgi:hypothetical protein